MIYNYKDLPDNDNLNQFSYCVNVINKMIIKKGKMIAYYGMLRFEAVGENLLDLIVQESINTPRYANEFITATGEGKLILGDRACEMASYDLEDAHLTVKASRVVAFSPTLTCQESTLGGYLTFLGTGQLIASSNGPVVFVEAPAKVDPEAVLGWADLPSPSYHYDYEYIKGVFSAVGSLAGLKQSGEERQLNFTGKGTILIQSSENGQGIN
ncbi:MAG: AIM24 family protein [Cyanobacteria bacterium SBLK]|nr:AIM24 family protein [Cyanobacteria bacterium SBLK]